MKPARFRYERVESAEDAVDALVRWADENPQILAGGQSLVPMMALRLALPGVLVDITRASDLAGWSYEDGMVRVSAAVTDRAVERDPELRARHPMLAAALELIGHPEIRNRGTVCGSVAHADPAAELPAVLVAAGGTVHVLGPGGSRQVGADDFFVGPFTTDLEEGQLVTAVDFPLPGPGTGWAIEEVARRHGDFALVGSAVVVATDAADRCVTARVCLFGVAGTPVRAAAAERVLVGETVDARVIEEAAERAFDEVDVMGDIHGSAEYRRRAGRVLVKRALAAACERTGHPVALRETV